MAKNDIANNGRGINLYTDPWCPVTQLSNGESKDVSFKDALLTAGDYKLVPATRFEQIAILRNLCALAGTILYRYDASGKEAPIQNVTEAIDRWKDAYENGFSAKAVKAYGEKWNDHFYLHDEKLPFYQTPNLKEEGMPTKIDKTLYNISKINPIVFESKNKVTQFATLKDDNKSILTEAELARGLMFIQAFNDNAAKDDRKPCGMSWPGHRTTVYAEGNTLLETILFNTPMVFDDNGRYKLWDSMTPEWERNERPKAPTFSSVIPKDLAKILTAQARRIELYKDEEHKLGPNYYEYGKSCGGDIYDREKEKVPGKKSSKVTKEIENPMNDPMIVCKHDRAKNEITISYMINNTGVDDTWLSSLDAYIKSQDKAITASEDDQKNGKTKYEKYEIKKKITSGLFSWLQFLDCENIASGNAQLHFTSVSYAKLNRFDEMKTTSSTIRVGLNHDEEWRDFLAEEVINVNAISIILNNFEDKMRSGTGNDHMKEPWAKTSFMDECRILFEKLMCHAKPGTDKEKLKDAWNKKLMSLTKTILVKLLERYRIDTATLREVEYKDKNGKKVKSKTYLSPGETYYVKKSVRDILGITDRQSTTPAYS